MKVGDLIKERDYPELGLLVKIKDASHLSDDGGVCLTPYGVMGPDGKTQWFTKAYIEEKCEVVSESR